MQIPLFGQPTDFRHLTQQAAAQVPGLSLMFDFVNSSEEAALRHEIDQRPWSNELSRRVQHYGYRYDYRQRRITHDSYLGPLPSFLQKIAQRLYAEGHLSVVPDQAIVNEYQPGQGIAPHIDCEPCFGESLASLSLGAPVLMQFFPVSGTDEPVAIRLEAGSLLALRGAARYDWLHGIPARKTDVWQGEKWVRQRRVSVTFRQVVGMD